MKRGTIIVCCVLIAGCGSKKKEATTCDSVAKHLVELDAGDKASFMTDKERASRAKRWIATCEPMSEAARKCVLAATTMDAADACGDGGSAASKMNGARAKAAWVVHGGDASYQVAKVVALAADGDVIAAGDFEGTLELGGQTLTAQTGQYELGGVVIKTQHTDGWVARLSPTGTVRWAKRLGGTGRDYVLALHHGTDGNTVIGLDAYEGEKKEPRFSRVTVGADGTVTPMPIAAEHDVSAAALHANGDISLGSRVVKTIRRGPCGAMNFAVQRFAADGKRQWSRCNDGKKEVALTDDPMQLAAGPDGITAVCGGFSGALAWAGKAAPEGGDKERAFVMALDAKGEPRWVTYVATDRNVGCDALAVTDDRSVVAILLGTAPEHALASWDTAGTQRWTRSCSDLLGEGDCYLWAVTGRGSDLVVAGEVDGRTIIATVDGKTGMKQQAHTFESVTRIMALAARANDIVFATGFSGGAKFGTKEVESVKDSEGHWSMDVLIGRL